MPDSLQPVPIDTYLASPGAAEPHLRRLFSPCSPRVIFDIGACEGEDSIRYSRLFPRSQVYAFEPLPTNQAIIRHNFAHHHADRAELVPLALSDHIGPATFHVSSGRPAHLFGPEEWNYGNKSSSLLAPASSAPMHGWIEFPEKIEVACDTLDAFCRRRGIARVDFIHMDVQGAEALVLAGAAHMLPHVGALWLEVSDQELYAGQKLRPHLEGILRAQGFRLVAEDRRAIEGDQFYVNSRSLGLARYAICDTLARIRRAIRASLCR